MWYPTKPHRDARSRRSSGAIGAEVDVVGDEPRLFRLDEVGEVFEARLQLVERPLANLRMSMYTIAADMSPGTSIDESVLVPSGADAGAGRDLERADARGTRPPRLDSDAPEAPGDSHAFRAVVQVSVVSCVFEYMLWW
jgi:hypothetical protein